MVLLEKQGRRNAVRRVGTRAAGLLALFASLFALPGCSGAPSKEEQTKLDEKGKQTNEAAMGRMIQEQGAPGARPGGGSPNAPGAPGQPSPR